jgi:hypothetical protein
MRSPARDNRYEPSERRVRFEDEDDDEYEDDWENASAEGSSKREQAQVMLY